MSDAILIFIAGVLTGAGIVGLFFRAYVADYADRRQP